MDKLQELSARADIHDVLLRYLRGVDRRDWAAIRATFHADAKIEHGPVNGSPDDFVSWVSKVHSTFPLGFHIIGNSLVEFASDTIAAVETYIVAIVRTPPDKAGGQEIDRQSLVRYLDRFEKRDGTWRIARRRLVYDGRFEQPAATNPLTTPGLQGRRDNGDPVYTLRKEAGLTS